MRKWGNRPTEIDMFKFLLEGKGRIIIANSKMTFLWQKKRNENRSGDDYICLEWKEETVGLSVGWSWPHLAWKNWRWEEVPINPPQLHILQFGLLPEWKVWGSPHLRRKCLFDFQERMILLTPQTKSLCLSWCMENNSPWLCLPFQPGSSRECFYSQGCSLLRLEAPCLIFQIVLFSLQLAFLS